MVSTPPGFQPPGWKPPPEIAKYIHIREVYGSFLFAMYLVLQARKAKRSFRVEHIDHYRTLDGRLHHKETGKYIKDPVPQHKRTIPIVPGNKGKKMKKKKDL